MTDKDIDDMKFALKSVKTILVHAPRIGDSVDIPEGVRYIQISETLVNRLLSTMENININET